MNAVCRFAIAAALVAVAAPWAQAQQPQPQPAAPPQQQQKPEQKPEEQPKYEETVVVSASRTEEKLVNAPATMSVIGAQTIQSAPTQNFAELLRTVPGLNITQVSSRDINITTRGATGTLATGQLAVLDGRSLYQDFFGFVMWDFLPVNLNEIKQIEVIRGPASAVWGANALYGVVNVITKSPREMQGTSFTMGVGGFDRSTDAVDQSAGTVFYVSGTHAQAVNDRWAYKISAGAVSQDAFARPTGKIPCTNTEVCTTNTASYPGFGNTGTTQPKFDTRVDYDGPDGRKMTFAGGVSGTKGIMESGIGPFDIDSGSVMGYGRVNYSQKGFHVAFFANVLNGDATNLLTRDVTGQPILFNFAGNTFDVEAANVQTFQARHVVTYGGNFRYNTFDLSLAPQADNRTEGGAYIQDEIFLSKMFRWVVGGRLDRFDYLDSFVFSPRTTFMIKPEENQTFRVSYNRAYRSPSVVNNFLDVTIAEPIDLTPFSVIPGLGGLAGKTFPLAVKSIGNQDLKETTLDAFEVGYTGVLNKRALVTAAFYVNQTKNDILFTEDTSKRYNALNPPPGWTAAGLPVGLLALVPGGLPAQFTYLNFGKTTQKGFELGLNSTINDNVAAFVNYSYQAKPEPHGFALSELNLPPANRFNLGVNFNRDRYVGDFSVAYTDSAFWQDVLDDRYHGTTDSYTLVNGGFGVKWAANRVTTSVKVFNLFNKEIQQHVFGDVLKRQIVGELRVQF
jgi:outer membrane receptor protein involved in Fe transport